MKKLFFALGIIALSPITYAEKIATTCHGCNSFQMKSVAGTVSRTNDIVNVLNFSSNTIETYKNHVEWDFEHNMPLEMRIIKIQTSQEDANRFRTIQRALNNFEELAAVTPIPADILGNVWDLPNRSYVKNDIKAHLKSQFSIGEITLESVKDVARQLGFVSGEINQYWVKTENGGKIRIAVKINGGVIGIEILEAIDSDSNTVPFDVNDVRSYRFSSNGNGNAAMGAFSRLGFSVKRIKSGGVTVIDCPNSETCKPKPKSKE